MSETTPLIKAALNLRVGVGFDVYVKSLSGHADTGAGLLKALPVFAVSKPGIVSVFVSNGAMGAISLKEVPLESSFWM